MGVGTAARLKSHRAQEFGAKLFFSHSLSHCFTLTSKKIVKSTKQKPCYRRFCGQFLVDSKVC